MEIYKLSDKIDEKSSKSSDDSEILKITDLKQGVKNPNRVNVYVNDDFAFSLDVAQVVDLKIKKGRVITTEELAEFKKASELGKLYQRTLEWILVRPHSEKECRDYLWRKLTTSSSETLGLARRYGQAGALLAPVVARGSSEDIRELQKTIVERLKARGYLDDLKFAEWYVENRFVKKGVSAKRLRMELMKKGIDKEIIDRVLNESPRDEREEIAKIIAKKRDRYTREKLTAYLLRQGFLYDLVQEQIAQSYEMD